MSALPANTHLEPRHGDPCVAGADALADGRLGLSATRRLPASNLAAFDDTNIVMHASTWVHDRQCIRNHHDAPEPRSLKRSPSGRRTARCSRKSCSSWFVR